MILDKTIWSYNDNKLFDNFFRGYDILLNIYIFIIIATVKILAAGPPITNPRNA